MFDCCLPFCIATALVANVAAPNFNSVLAALHLGARDSFPNVRGVTKEPQFRQNARIFRMKCRAAVQKCRFLRQANCHLFIRFHIHSGFDRHL